MEKSYRMKMPDSTENLIAWQVYIDLTQRGYRKCSMCSSY